MALGGGSKRQQIQGNRFFSHMWGESEEVLEQLKRSDGCGEGSCVLRKMMYGQASGRIYPMDMRRIMGWLQETHSSFWSVWFCGRAGD